jgi:hypothetical protein
MRIGAAPLHPLARQSMVAMRDGVRLATDVYLPEDGADAGPTLLIRLPYDKCGDTAFVPEIAECAVARGYRVVAQDVRGKFRSEGERLLFANEGRDGYDTIDWIVQQPWSNGIVGMLGDSYYGYTQWAAVATGHPALRAIVPGVTGTRLGSLPRMAADGRTGEVEAGMQRLYGTTFFHGNDIYLWEPDWQRRPYVDSVEEFFAAVGFRSDAWDMWFPHPVVIDRFPDGNPLDARPVPTLLRLGWWDNCARWQWEDVAEIARRSAWALNTYMLIESRDHDGNLLEEGRPSPEHGGREMEQALAPTLEFFDVFLRNAAPPESIPRVRWSLAHTEGLQVSESWPPHGVGALELHLTADGRLTSEPAPGGTELQWTHDPDDLVPSPYAATFNFLTVYPDEQEWSERHDVLAFSAEPVARELDLVGAVRLTGSFGSDGPVLDLFARLLDVWPDGSARLITRGQLRVIEAGDGTEVELELGQVGYRLQAGHALRLHITASEFPEFLPQPGTGENPWTAVQTRPNRQTLQEGARLTLGVLHG